jgi:hypothetical protein
MGCMRFCAFHQQTLLTTDNPYKLKCVGTVMQTVNVLLNSYRPAEMRTFVKNR